MNRSISTYCQTLLDATFSGAFVGSSFTSKAQRERLAESINYRSNSSDEGNACGITDSKAQRERLAGYATFSGKERDEETGFGYFGARYYDSELLTGWMSVDPMSDKYPGLSPYNYCAWNPLKLVDPDGRDIYRLNTKTGSLTLYKKTKSKTDRVEAGTYSNVGRSKNIWNASNQIEISKGILNGGEGKDLSEIGFTTTGGNQRDGLRLARFISFECYREISGVGFENNKKEELDVFRWDKNTSWKANVFFSDKDNITFSFHTHPGDRLGKGGYSGLDKADRECACQARQLYGTYQNYIITRHDGIQYYNEWNIIPKSIYVLPKSFRGIYQ